MATEGGNTRSTLAGVAGEDLSAKAGYIAKMNSSGVWVLASTGEMGFPIIVGAASGGAITLATPGYVACVVAGAAIATPFTTLKADSAGKVQAAVKGRTDTSDAGAAVDPLLGSNVLGFNLTAAAGDLSVIEMLVCPVGAVPTTAA
jgi:hypothetical protein